jgi:hypothetical protein
MRKIKQISVSGKTVYALCEDGTLWAGDKTCEQPDPVFDPHGRWLVDRWHYIEGPPEGRPPQKPLTLEEQAEALRQVGNKTFVGRGHHLHKEGEE